MASNAPGYAVHSGGGGALDRIRSSLTIKLLLATGAGLVVLWGCVFYLVQRSSRAIIEQQAVNIAEIVNARIRAMRKMYTHNIVKKLTSELPGQVKGSVNFDKVGEIPLPAVFVKLVGEETEKISTLSKYNLVSGWNINLQKGTEGAGFDNDAWKFLVDQQNKIKAEAGSDNARYLEILKDYKWLPYSRVEMVDGRETLRFMAADPASDPGCVNCHNGLETKPDIMALRKSQGFTGVKVFQLNELMGSLSISVPIDQAGAFAAGQARKVLAVFTVLVLCILGLIFLMLSRSTARIRQLTAVAARIVNEGDLTQNIVADSSDEVGQLANSFSQMVGSLREVIKSYQDAAETLNQSTGTLTESAQTLTGAVGKLTSATTEQSQTVTRQAASLQETQVTAQEIKQTSLLASQKAEEVLRVTERADEVSRTGSEAIEKSIGGLADVRAQADEITRKIAELNERTRRISGITDTVKGLADQSNMLALNAAIEAVRSGEHGKGFAVVAREIRNLADQSIQATTQVQEILADISGAIDQAVGITQRGAQKMEGGLDQVRASGGNLRELSVIVKDNSSAVRQIAAAVSQQNAGISQIFSSVTDQSKMMDETIKRLDSTKQAASTVGSVSQRVLDVSRRMNDISRSVSELVRRYRV